MSQTLKLHHMKPNFTSMMVLGVHLIPITAPSS